MPLNSVTAAAIAAPATLFVVANVASCTAQISGSTDSVKRTVYVTGGVLLAAAIASGDGVVFASTAIAIAAISYLLFPIYFGNRSLT